MCMCTSALLPHGGLLNELQYTASHWRIALHGGLACFIELYLPAIRA